MVLAYYEILTRLYSMRNSIMNFNAPAHETAQMIGDLIQEMEEK